MMIGLIGCGNMGSAIIKGGITSKVLKGSEVFVYDVVEQSMNKMLEMGINKCKSNDDLLEKCDIIILATKPQYTQEIIEAINPGLLKNKAIISILAGMKTNTLKEMMPDTRILRVMPNTAALVFEGATVFSLSTDFFEEEKDIAKNLFNSIGKIEWIEENLIDAISGFSGAGPAYVAMIIEAMSDGAVKQGIPRKVAYQLAAQTLLGSAKLFLETQMSPSQMKDMVTSPGGVTIAGVEALEKGNIRYAFMDCIDAATKRAKELGQK
ncbi:MAG: pyrroline-5-carboxylate reductase [Candidatus Epulonipiscioides saccharophilum]|nr:MAG: pyrroline-5-carboxylate reductase [Epulopiscium sp. AS2M-Bin001]